MELQFAELFNLILASIVILQSVMIHRSVSREDWKAYLDKSDTAAAKTESKIDDKIAGFQRNIFTPILDKLGVFNASASEPTIFDDIESKNADNPLVGLPESKPVEPFTNVSGGMTKLEGTNYSFYTPDETDKANG